MAGENDNVPRVVRTGPKVSKKKRYKKPLPKGLQYAKTFFVGILKTLISILLVFTITGCICGVAFSLYVLEYVNSAEAIVDLTKGSSSQNTLIYAKDATGADVEVSRLKRGSKTITVNYPEVPQDLKDAIVYTEDERFWTHTGIDYKRTLGAVINEVGKKLKLLPADKTFGGSTITQQVIKNINGDIYDRSIDVKIKEIIGALNLSQHYSREQILESYLNTIGLHFDIIGVGAGAKYYFNKDVSELALDECAALAVISKSPTNYNPIDNPKKNQERRRYAYDKMLEFGAITQEEYDSVYDKELVVVKSELAAGANALSYYEDAVIEEVIEALMSEYDYSRKYAEDLLYTSGYSVYTPMEIETQKILEDYFADLANFYPDGADVPNKKGYVLADHVPDAAYMVIMNYDGDIVAVVGNKGEKTTARGLNRATTSTRPAGSTIKPLSIYAPAFENDIINWSTIMFDEPIMQIEDEKTKEKRNWPLNYNNKYEGPFTMIDAIKVSKNTIPVRLSYDMTPQVSFDFVYDTLQLRSLKPSGSINDVAYSSMALGDGGTILTDLTAAFQIFGNGGYYKPHRTFLRVEDKDGKVILDRTNDKKVRAISSQTSYVMNKALHAVVNDGGSGAKAAMKDYEVVGKTGTSNDRKDLLFVGLTPYYIGGIRYGNDDNSVIENDGTNQIIVWREVMEKVHKGLNPAKFDMSDDGVVVYEYCTASGKLAHSGCPTKKSGYYKSSYIPESCLMHGFDGTVDPLQAPVAPGRVDKDLPSSVAQ